MANTFLQKNQQSFGNNTIARTLQYSSNVTSGSLLTLYVGALPGSGTAEITLTVSDNVNGSWTQAGTTARNTNNGVQGSWWYFVNSAGGSRPIVSVTPGASAALGLGIHEHSVTTPASVTVDGTITNQSGASTSASPTTGTCTVSGSGELVMAGFSQTTGALTGITVASPFTIQNTQTSAASMSMGTADDTNASASEAATFSITAINVKYAAAAVSFNTGGGASGMPVKLAGVGGGLVGIGGGLAGFGGGLAG